MLNIGICDSNAEDSKLLKSLCEEYSRKEKNSINCISFATGEELFAYCDSNYDCRFDMLFLEIELNGMNWLEIKKRVEHMNNIREIIFLTNKKEYMQCAFGMKVRGFEVKPADRHKVERVLNMLITDIQQDTVINLGKKQEVRFKQIFYFVSEGTYTRIFFYSDAEKKHTSYLSTKPIKNWEQRLKHLPVIRIHKSYMVNLLHIQYIGSKIKLDMYDLEIPIGRLYKKEVLGKHFEFQRKKQMTDTLIES